MKKQLKEPLLHFLILGALIFALSLLRQRYITKTPRAMQSRGSFTMFAILMLIFSFGALMAGLVSL